MEEGSKFKFRLWKISHQWASTELCNEGAKVLRSHPLVVDDQSAHSVVLIAFFSRASGGRLRVGAHSAARRRGVRIARTMDCVCDMWY